MSDTSYPFPRVVLVPFLAVSLCAVVPDSPLYAQAPRSVPTVPTPSDLPGLSSARSNEDRCEVLLQWLQRGEAATGAQPTASRSRQPASMLPVFRDELMTAVFGRTYDRMDHRWRAEQHEKVISGCLQGGRPRSVPLINPRNPRRSRVVQRAPSRTMQTFAEQFRPYRPLLDQAFLGRPGPFDPASVLRYLEQVRSQVRLANEAVAGAATAEPTQEGFDLVSASRESAQARLGLLTAEESAAVADYLSRRQAEIAAVVAERWLQDAERAARTVVAARQLVNERARLSPVLSALDGSTRSTWESRYTRTLDGLVAEPLEAELTRLRAVEPTLPGVQQLAIWKTGFDGAFGGLRSLASVQAALAEYAGVRAGVGGGALPVWQAQVAAIPLDAPSIAAKQRELDGLFPDRADRSGPLFAQFESPIRAKEDELRLQLAAEARREQEALAAARRAALGASAPAADASIVTGDSFTAAGLNNRVLLTSLFTGDFARVEFDRSSFEFAALFEEYLKSYAGHCAAYLPPDKVEMTRRECSTERVTRNGFGTVVGRECISYVTVATGLYADPVLYDTLGQVLTLVAADTFRQVGRMLTQSDPVGRQMGTLRTMQSLRGDMNDLVRMNACNGPGLRRFEENLGLFALNRRPVRLADDGSPSAVTTTIPGLPYRDQNYERLMEDLVSVQARSWALNRYIAGTVRGVAVTSRDAEGRPERVSAHYMFDGFDGRTQGSVDVSFSEGLPECMYFFDAPYACRTPNRRIVAAYADGAYQP